MAEQTLPPRSARSGISKQIFTGDQLQIFGAQIRTLLNLGLRLKILSGQSKARNPRSQEESVPPARKPAEHQPGAGASDGACPALPAPAAAHEMPQAPLPAQPPGIKLAQQPSKEKAYVIPAQQHKLKGRPPKAPGREAIHTAKKRRRDSPEASVDLEATSEGDSDVSGDVDVSGESDIEGAQKRSTSPHSPSDGPPSRRSGRKTRQVSLDGVSGDVLDALVDDPIPAQDTYAAAKAMPAAGAKRARKPGKGKGRNASGLNGGLMHLQSEAVGIPDHPTLLPQLTPVAGQVVDPEDPPCNICGDKEDGEGNEMLMCDGKGCKVVAHQACYGVTMIPAGDWLCDGCQAGLDPNQSHCLLCPVPSGALRQVTSFGNWRPPGTSVGTPHVELTGWVHTGCALWMPEIKMTQPDLLAGVDLSELPCERVRLTCGLCHQPGGSVMECSLGACDRLQHVSCARQSGCLTPIAGNGAALAFCPLHSRPRFLPGRNKAATACQAPEQPDEDDEAPAKALSEYELERQANIERNRQRLAELAGAPASR
ncbi:hypothetical protein WJX74_005001 [Apatococcus lobatus]|uniref:PHD-type domain-containing protein n=1 Tax=Apatococcus lobatus TaxID=904363 RepID=A0AAW1SG84_9CHLO